MADPKSPPAWLPPHDAPDGKAWRCPDCPSWATLLENAHAHQIATGHGRPALGDQSPPPSAEKLALRGEPTARTILQVFAAQVAHIPPSMTDDRPLYAYAGAPKITIGDFRRAAAYLSTRAPAEEALIEASIEWAAAERAMRDLRDARDRGDFDRPLREFTPANERLRAAIGVRDDDCAFALPVEGRAPAERKKRPGEDCTCYMDCGADSHSGEWHQHGDEPCPEHPDAPMVDGPPPSFEKQSATGRAPDASHEKKLDKKGAKP